jgi:DNA-binding response OmpR family regulator
MSAQNLSVLVVEDEGEIRELICLHLQREGFAVDEAVSGEQALARIFEKSYDLLVLDWMLPSHSGLDITRMVRSKDEFRTVPILMVTARAENEDIVLGLEAGADDYLTKPFDPAVLMARVNALLRRRAFLQGQASAKGAIPAVYQIENLTINTETYEVRCHSEKISLTPSEFKLLVALVQSRGKVLTRDSLIEYVQGEGVSVVGRTVDTHVFGLRKKLGQCSDLLETVRGVGYRVK